MFSKGWYCLIQGIQNPFKKYIRNLNSWKKSKDIRGKSHLFHTTGTSRKCREVVETRYILAAWWRTNILLRWFLKFAMKSLNDHQWQQVRPRSPCLTQAIVSFMYVIHSARVLSFLLLDSSKKIGRGNSFDCGCVDRQQMSLLTTLIF